MPEHKHAWVLRAIADGEPIENFEVWYCGEFVSLELHPASLVINEAYEIRRKPRTIRIGNFDVPEPLREAPKLGAVCWVATVSRGVPISCEWGEGIADTDWLALGLLHATKEDAQLHIDAMLSFTRTDK